MAYKVFVFIDTSNMFIQGMHAIAALEDAGQWGPQRVTRQLSNARIDYGSLLHVMLNGRQLGGVPLLVGSRPPPNDTLWDKLMSQGLDVSAVKVFDRNAANTFIVTEVMETLYTSGGPGCTVALMAGDGDYEPLANKIAAKGWNLEVYFWRTGADMQLAGGNGHAALYEQAKFCIELDDLYKKFAFAVGSDNSKGRPYLEVSSPELALMKNEDVMQSIVQKIGEIFGWWDWANKPGGDNELKIFFRDTQQQKRALAWFEANHPDWVVKVNVK